MNFRLAEGTFNAEEIANNAIKGSLNDMLEADQVTYKAHFVILASTCTYIVAAQYDEKREEGPARAARDGDIVPADVQAAAGRGQEWQDGLQPQVSNLYIC